MSGFPGDWALCGGWAVDAWLGRENREHQDVDIAVFHDDQSALYAHTAGWKLIGHDDEVPDDSDEPWNGRTLTFPAHIHARGDDGFELEFHLNERAGDAWLFSREPLVSLPLRQCVRPSPWGIRAVVPEVIVYYKALPPGWRGSRPELRPHDQGDLFLLLPLLDRAQRDWVHDAISRTDPGHPWLAELA